MSKPFNKPLHTDIIKLRDLSAEGKKSAYRVLFEQIKKKYDLSQSTVYEEMRKETPGAYKKSSRGPALVNISKRELELVAGAIIRKESGAQICRWLSVQLGFVYSKHRLARARETLAQNAARIQEEKSKVIPCRLGSPETLARMEKMDKMKEEAAKLAEYRGLEQALYADANDTRRFFFILAGLDLTDPKAVIRLQIGEKEYDVSVLVIKEALEHIAQSAGSGGKDIYTACRFDIETLLISKLRGARNGNYLSPGDFKQLVAIHKTLSPVHSGAPADSDSDYLASVSAHNSAGGYTLDDVCRVVRHFSPATTGEEVQKFLDAA
jgi:hypothetical protein